MPSDDWPRFAAPRLLFGAGILLGTLGACAAPPAPANGNGETTHIPAAGSTVLSGTVTYLPRIALPPNAVVHVRIEDVSRADAPAITLAEQTIPTEGRQVPSPFALEYDPSRIEGGHRYAVRAEIRGPGEGLLWTTDTMHPVLTLGAPSDRVEVRVVQAMNAPGPGEMSALAGPEWRLVRIETAAGAAVTPDGDELYTLTFGTDSRYNGQADCNRYGGEYRIEGGDRLELERGLSTLAACAPPSVSEDFFRVLNEVKGFSVGGDQLRLTASNNGTLVFEQGGGADRLAGTEWRLLRIERAGGAISPDADEPYTIAFGPDGRFNGQVDCNRYFGEYTVSGDSALNLSNVGITRAACPPGSQSNVFMEAINAVQRFTIAGSQLRLGASDGGTLIFERADPSR